MDSLGEIITAYESLADETLVGLKVCGLTANEYAMKTINEHGKDEEAHKELGDKIRAMLIERQERARAEIESVKSEIEDMENGLADMEQRMDNLERMDAE
ncbi:MAG: hypothetical protein NC114_10555 [Ruminococcus flavefaciens]|nr:hypothetical protein [Ruminococcus flavefaciens]